MGSEFWKKSRQVFMATKKITTEKNAFLERADELGESYFVPMDVYETKGAFIVELDIPGVTISDINITVHEGRLTIDGLKKDVIVTKEKIKYLCMEREFGPVRRFIKLPAAVDTNHINASYHMGVLSIKIPKLSDRRMGARRIPIE